jgi:hypothetical protein
MESGEPDYVRTAIGEALRPGIVVIPVRVGLGGRMPELPRAEDLQDSFRECSGRCACCSTARATRGCVEEWLDLDPSNRQSIACSARTLPLMQITRPD